MTAPPEDSLRVTTGDVWDAATMRPVPGPESADASPHQRRSRDYISRFAAPIPIGRAVRLKCSACMGGEADQMPRGEVAQAIDECGSVCCPLWPFRYGSNPWRSEVSEARREASRRNAARLHRRDATIAREAAQDRGGEHGADEEP